MSKISYTTTQDMIDDHVKKLSEKELKIIHRACDLVGVNINKLWGSSCNTDVSNCRKLLSLYFINQKYTLVRIGETLRAVPLDHTSIIYCIKCARNHYATEVEFKNWYNELTATKLDSNWQEKSVSIKKSLASLN